MGQETASIVQAGENILAFLLTASRGICIINTLIFISLESIHWFVLPYWCTLFGNCGGSDGKWEDSTFYSPTISMHYLF